MNIISEKAILYRKKQYMFLFLFFVWIIFNGRLTVETALFGLVISGLVYFFICHFLDYSPRIDRFALRNPGLFIKYFALLFSEIVKANFAVIRMIMSSRYDVEPAIVSFDTDFKTDSARVMLANSITLTPGTITMTVDGDRFTVHCLDISLAEGIKDSEFVTLLHEFENRWEKAYGGFDDIPKCTEE